MQKKKKQYTIKRDFLDFGEYLKAMRIESGLTQREVADSLNYSSAQFISNFERGIALPPLNKLKVLMKLYKMPKSEVVNRISEARTKLMNNYL